MNLEARLAKLEARYGVVVLPPLAAVVAAGADDATIRAHYVALMETGELWRLQDHATRQILDTHPAFAEDRAQTRADLRQWEYERFGPAQWAAERERLTALHAGLLANHDTTQTLAAFVGKYAGEWQPDPRWEPDAHA